MTSEHTVRDPREHGVGAGDVVDFVVRGRVSAIGPAGVSIDGADRHVVFAYLPAELIVSASLVEAEEPQP